MNVTLCGTWQGGPALGTGADVTLKRTHHTQITLSGRPDLVVVLLSPHCSVFCLSFLNPPIPLLPPWQAHTHTRFLSPLSFFLSSVYVPHIGLVNFFLSILLDKDFPSLTCAFVTLYRKTSDVCTYGPHGIHCLHLVWFVKYACLLDIIGY